MMKTTKINAMSAYALDDLIAPLRKRMPAFLEKYDFNIAVPLVEDRPVNPDQFQDWRECGRDIIKQIEILMAETQETE